MCGRCYISRIGEVLLSISSAYHIHLLCKMHFESCAISHDYQSKRYEKTNSTICCMSCSLSPTCSMCLQREDADRHTYIHLQCRLHHPLQEELCVWVCDGRRDPTRDTCVRQGRIRGLTGPSCAHGKMLIRLCPRGDKMTMLTHAYPHKPLRKMKVAICNHQADSFTCGLMSDLVICKHRKESVCTWHWMSLLRPAAGHYTTQNICGKMTIHMW